MKIRLLNTRVQSDSRQWDRKSRTRFRASHVPRDGIYERRDTSRCDGIGAEMRSSFSIINYTSSRRYRRRRRCRLHRIVEMQLKRISTNYSAAYKRCLSPLPRRPPKLISTALSPWHKLCVSLSIYIYYIDFVRTKKKLCLVYMSYTRTLFDPFRPPSLNESTSTVSDWYICTACVSHVMCVYICTEINGRSVFVRVRRSCMPSWRRVG